MVGRGYTMKEMKLIVDYLTERRLYAEIKGRRMWVDLAHSKILDRTWQSLKETFLKRILPDIHNPYYKLSVEQIASFRQGYDIESKTEKLEIVTLSEDTSTGGSDPQKKNDNTKTQDEKTGENQHSKIQSRTRSSTDTIILESCDDDADDAQKEQENDETTAPKSLRDLITYSAPLTPMLQDVIDDFATDDDEPQLQIVEEPEPDTTEIETNNRRSKSPNPIHQTQSYNKKTETNREQEKSAQSSKIKLKLKKTQKGTWENKEVDENFTFTVRENETNNNECNENTGTDIFAPNIATNHNGEAVKSVVGMDSMADTPLPNNQEELGNKPNENRTSSESANSGLPKPPKKNKKDKSRKRSHSSSTDSKKKKKDKVCDVSETREQDVESFHTFNSHPHAIAEVQLVNSGKSLENGLITPTEKEVNSVDTTSNNDQNCSNINSLEAVKGTMDVVEEVSIAKNNEGTSQEAGPSGINNINNNSEILKPDEINPCLQSVNLYEEQFSQSKYSDLEEEEPTNKESDTVVHTNKESDAVVHIDPASKDTVDEKITENRSDENPAGVSSDTKESTSEVSNKNVSKKPFKDDILLLKSNSDSDSENFVVPQKKVPTQSVNTSRSKVLANIFGFASGGGPSRSRAMNHKTSRQISRHSRVQSRNVSNTFESGSSDDYTTDSSGEKRPQSRGQSRRYLKPQSYDILSHEGNLFVVGRKKIYPIVLQESGSQRYSVLREEQDGGTESFWKSKYLEMKQKIAEEKIRADELARLLKKAKDESRRHSSRSESPIPEIKQPSVQNNNHTKTENSTEQKNEEMVKIKFTKNKEIELEGQWPHVTPMFEKMVQIFKNNEAQNQNVIEISNSESGSSKEVQQTETNQILEKSSVKIKPDSKVIKAKNTDESIEISSGVSGSGVSTPQVKGPVDPEVQKQVDKIEGEIFKKIEEIEKTGQSAVADNITKRKRGRPRKESTSSVSSSGSLAKKSKPLKTEDPSKIEQPEPPKIQEEPTIQEEPITDQATKEKQKDKAVKSKMQDTKKKTVVSKSNAAEESDASASSKRNLRPPRRYGSDTRVEQQPKKSNLSLTKSNTTIPDDPNVKYMFPPSTRTRQIVNSVKNSSSYSNYASCITSPDNSRSSESTLGYQDSDVSPQKILRRKRKLSTGHTKSHQRRTRNSCPYLADDDSCEVPEPRRQTISFSNITSNSDVYKSDSYALLFPKKKPIVLLSKIDESPDGSTKPLNKMDFDNLTPLTINVSNEFYVPQQEIGDDSLKEKSSTGNFSNVSLPLSPELSVVENLSITRDSINELVDHPTLNEIGTNGKLTTNCTKYLISNMDVSVPLMGQDCKFKNLRKNTQSIPVQNTISKSMLDDLSSGPIEEQLSSESLDMKLKELLLESAKKAVQNELVDIAKENFMDVDITPSIDKKARARKRSSTPQKKKIASKSKPPDVDCVLEEHTESCSISGRTSCPPAINIVPCEDPLPIPENGDKNNSEEINNLNTRGRKKKNVIRVKILRPRSKSGARDDRCSRISACTDSGINDTGFRASESSYNCSDESTELRHNHSDTCLMDDCVSDSVELIENTTSIITIDSDSSCLVSQIEHASNVGTPNGTGAVGTKPDEIDLLLSSLEKTNEPTSNLAIPTVTELGFKIPSNNEIDSEEFVTPELFCSDAQDATVVSSGDLALKLLSQDANAKSPVLSTPATTTYHSPCNSFDSLLTDDLSEDSPVTLTQVPADTWYLFSEDDSTLADATNLASTRGSNLNHIFPVTCAIPNLSTITESSKSPKLMGVESPSQSQSLFGLD